MSGCFNCGGDMDANGRCYCENIAKLTAERDEAVKRAGLLATQLHHAISEL
jgi:hypothetical protein